jgi:hypothetical protein
MVVACCSLAAFGLYQCSPGVQAQKFATAGSSVGRGMEKLLADINGHHITETFVDHLQTIKPDLQNRLLVAEGKATEDFSAKDVSWHGTATAALRVSVTYHYYVALTDPWDLRVTVTPAGVVGDVLAPALRPLEPAVDTSQLETQNANGWANWGGNQLADDLLKDLSVKLNQRATQQMPLYYPAGREAVEKFVRDWMLKQYDLPPGTPVYLRIRFSNESAAQSAPGTVVGQQKG